MTLSRAWAVEFCPSNGLLHGGAVMALADAASGACALLNLPDGAAGTSHVGSTTIAVETEVRTAERLVAKVTQTQAVLRRRES